MNVRNGKYIERHYGDICDLSKKREDKKTHATKMKMQKTILHEMPLLITRRRTTFFTISRKHPIYRQHILSITLILLQKNFEISSEHNHARNNHAIKSIKEIMENGLKSYRKHAHLLMKLLFRKVVPNRIS